jgi:hypothetical protein
MKVRLAFWSAVLLAVIGAHASEGALFYFFTAHLLAVSTGFFLLGLEHRPRAKVKAQASGKKPSAPPPKAKAG